jgi:alpha-beta hydrolase superfamily lysophospholipase
MNRWTRPAHARAMAADYRWVLRVRRDSLRGDPQPDWFGRGDGRPVVLVPGVFETWHYLRFVARPLAEAGHPVFAVPGLGFNAGPIPEAAELVAARLRELDVRDAVLLAHSKGGLVAKLAMADADALARTARIVALATPFAGSSLARWTALRATRAFRTTDPVIVGLGRELAANARITSIYPGFDPHIPEGSRLDGAAANLQIRMAGHFGILEDPRALDAVAAAAR